LGNILVTNHKITSGIQEKCSDYANDELYRLACQNDFDVPDGYALSQINRPMLMNDFVKFAKDRRWDPNPLAWNWSSQLTVEQCSPYLKGGVLSYSAAKARAERGKAPGYPFDKMFKNKGQVYDDPYCDKMLWTIIHYLMLTPGAIVRTYHKSSPKVEIRPLDKLMGSNPKQRVFMCCEMLFYTVGIMLYGDQNDSFLKAWDTTNFSAVGVSLQYGQWHKLFEILTSGKPLEEALRLVFHSFDISAMEATIRIPVFMSIYKMRFSNLVIPPHLQFYYMNLHNWFISVLFYAFVIDPHGFLIVMFGGNPSGGFNTLTDNGYAQMHYKYYSIAKHCNTWSEFVDYVSKLRIKMVGDDCIEQDHPLIKYYIEDCKDLGVDVKYECDPGSITTQKFLNFKWVIDRNHGMMVPGANLEKMLSNIFHHRKRNSWRLTYVKLQAIRFFTQIHPEIDFQIQYYIKYIENNHMKDMKEEKLDDVLTLRATLAQSLSLDQLQFMMYGLQAEAQF
jgi:hypothetical protein